MIHFPGFLKGHHEKGGEKVTEKNLAMKGWGNTELTETKQSFTAQQHLSRGIGYHFARNSITRGRGQARFTGK